MGNFEYKQNRKIIFRKNMLLSLYPQKRENKVDIAMTVTTACQWITILMRKIWNISQCDVKWNNNTTKFSMRKTIDYLILSNIKFMLAKSRVCGFRSFFERSIFLRECEGFSFSCRRSSVYINSGYPVVLYVCISNSFGFTSLFISGASTDILRGLILYLVA